MAGGLLGLGPVTLPMAPRQGAPRAEIRLTTLKIFTDQTLTTTMSARAVLSRTPGSMTCIADWFLASRYQGFEPGRATDIHVELDDTTVFHFETSTS
jgi:hypothetical protein